VISLLFLLLSVHALAGQSVDKFLGKWQLNNCNTTQCCCVTQMDVVQSGGTLYGNAKLTGTLCGGRPTETASAPVPANGTVSFNLSTSETLTATFSDNGTFSGINSQNGACNADGTRSSNSSSSPTASVMVWKSAGCSSTPSYGTARAKANTCIDLSTLNAGKYGGK
jgi:hypothetical protein